MRKEWQDFLLENALEIARLASRLDNALEKGEIEKAKDCLTTLWVKHGITLDEQGNLRNVISFDFLEARKNE